MDFSLTAILSTLAPPAAGSAPSGKSKRNKKAKSDAEGPSTDAAEAVEPVVEQRLAAAFGAAISGEEPALLPPTALENTKKRKLVSIDDLEGELGEAEEQEKGKPSKSALKRAAQRESRERLGRTVFIGNLEPLITGKEVKRLAAAILAELPGIALDALVPRRARGAVDEDEVPQDDEDEEEDQPDLDDLNESDVPTSDDEDGTAGAGTATLPPGTLRRIESVRLRSVPISGTAVASGSDYKMMRKACAIKGAIDSTSGIPVNAYVVLRSTDDAQKLLTANGELFRGRHLRVDLANGEGSSKDPKLSVFIGNLPFTATEEGLRTWVAPAVDGGNDSITNVRLVRDKATNRGKGIAYVAFRERMHVFQALSLHGKEYEKRAIRVTHCRAQDGPVVSKKDKEEQARRKELALKRLKESPRQKAKQELKGKREKNKAKKLVRTMKRQAAAGAKK